MKATSLGCWAVLGLVALTSLAGLSLAASNQHSSPGSTDAESLESVWTRLLLEQLEANQQPYDDNDPGDVPVKSAADKTAGKAKDTAASKTPGKTAEATASKPVIQPVEAAAVHVAANAAATNAAKKKRPEKAPKINIIVTFAPEANITFGDDIDDDGKCEKEIEELCEDMEQGDGQLADCISDAIAESESGQEDAPEISDACRGDVFQFKISRNAKINKNVPLAKACKADAERFCNVTWFFGYKAGQVTACLRDVKAQLSKPCKQQVFKTMMDAAVDFRSDPILYEACKDDSQSLCKNVKNGGVQP